MRKAHPTLGVVNDNLVNGRHRMTTSGVFHVEMCQVCSEKYGYRYVSSHWTESLLLFVIYVLKILINSSIDSPKDGSED